MSVAPTLGPWLLVSSLGAVEDGEVHLATRRSGGALARIHVGHGADVASWHARASAIRHPSSLPVIARGEADGRPWLAWEACAEPSLREIVVAASARGLRLPLPFACLIGLDVARWLHHVHTRTDAKARPLRLAAVRLDGGAIHVGLGGTVRVSAPVGPVESGVAGDVERLAALLAAALVGEAGGAAVERTEAGPEARELRALRTARPDVPVALVDLLARATAAEPRIRPGTVRELGDGLIATALRGLEESAVRRDLATWVDDLLGERTRERAAAWLAGARGAIASRRVLDVEVEREAAVAAGHRETRGRLGLAAAVAVVAAVAVPWATQASARSEVAPLAPGGLEVRVAPAGTVAVDGRPQGSGELVAVPEVTPGRHVVRASAPGHVPAQRAVPVVRGGTTRLDLSLEPAAVAAPVVLVLDSRPTGATVRVDGAVVGRTPTTVRLPVGDGAFRVQFERLGFTPEIRTLGGVSPGARRRVAVVLAPPGQRGGDLP